MEIGCLEPSGPKSSWERRRSEVIMAETIWIMWSPNSITIIYCDSVWTVQVNISALWSCRRIRRRFVSVAVWRRRKRLGNWQHSPHYNIAELWLHGRSPSQRTFAALFWIFRCCNLFVFINCFIRHRSIIYLPINCFIGPVKSANKPFNSDLIDRLRAFVGLIGG